MNISLIVPVQDEEESIDVLLDSINAQTRQPDEIVIVDAGSTDGTRRRVDARRSSVEELKLVTGQRVYPGVARNLGVSEARHEWLAFTDVGIQLDPRWLEGLIGALGDPPAEVVFGSYEPTCDTPFRRAAALAYVPGPGPDGLRGPSVTSLLMARRIFQRVGGFSAHRAGEDLLFMQAIRVTGCTIRHAPGAVARWSTPPDISRTFRRFRLYSYHNLVAGLGAGWHRGLARLYLGAAALAGLALAMGLGSVVGILIPGFYLARVLRASVAKRGTLPFNTANPCYVLAAALVVVAVDAASLFGAIEWVIQGRPSQP